VDGKPLEERVFSYFFFFSFYSIKIFISFSSQFLILNKLVWMFEGEQMLEMEEAQI